MNSRLVSACVDDQTHLFWYFWLGTWLLDLASLEVKNQKINLEYSAEKTTCLEHRPLFGTVSGWGGRKRHLNTISKSEGGQKMFCMAKKG